MPKSDNYFICINCGKYVLLQAPGTKNRNHCPFCLFSQHVDLLPGDRAANCGGKMKPIGKVIKNDGEEVLVHECENCGMIRKNRIAGDDSIKLVDKLSVFEYF